MSRTQDLGSISTRLQRIARLARVDPQRALVSLSHYIDEYWLLEAYSRTRKDGAVGVDGQTARQYSEDLRGNLRRLLEGFKSGSYKAPPVRRVEIPKGSGSSTRPIGIPTFEDKVLQRAVAMVVETVYEEDFLDFSYGFRPGRSAHDAVDAVWKELMGMEGGWVLEVDIRSFFDELDHGHLRGFLDQRVRDGVIRRMIDKWLKAGVLEGERRSQPESGTPQGGVISPLLANIYLHEVVDRWFVEQVQPRLQGRASMVRYADDFVLLFASEEDARRVWEVLPQRLGRYGLRLHPDKTRRVEFRKPGGEKSSGGTSPGSFDFLGFTHFWGKGRRGQWVVKRKTAKDRFTRSLLRVRAWCRRWRHIPVAAQQRRLSQRLRGHYAYYGIIGNYLCLGTFHRQVTREWRKWLNRRSQKAGMTWARFVRLQELYPLARPRIVHRV
jgi:RNA-directed DNA polymerase